MNLTLFGKTPIIFLKIKHIFVYFIEISDKYIDYFGGLDEIFNSQRNWREMGALGTKSRNSMCSSTHSWIDPNWKILGNS